MTLLLVDDDKISVDILAEYIKPHLKNIREIRCAYDGNEAYDIVLSVKPKVIVSDIKMPNLSGIEFIKKVRSIEAYNPKIIIISSYSDFEYAREALKLNVFDYIVKPIDHEELAKKVNECMNDVVTEKADNDIDIYESLQYYISNNLSEQIRLVDISVRFHYNAAYLGRLIKEKSGCNFNEYVLKLRILKAQSLLIQTHDLIHKISADVGFKDPEHFSKKFKKITGLTPTDFRNQTRPLKP
jgi:two-component system, response regulator YesN